MVHDECAGPSRPGQASPALLVLALSGAIACGDGGTEPRIEITPLAVGTPVTDMVLRGEAKFYAVSVTAGALYHLSLTGLSDDVDLYVFGADGTFTFPARCLIDHTLFFGTAPEDCVAAAPGDTLYVAVDASDAAALNATYTIAVQTAPLTDLTLSVPLEASVANGGVASYRVGVTPGTAYSVSITGLTDSAASFHALEGDQGGSLSHHGSPKELGLVALGSTIYLAVEGSGLAQPTASFRLLATPAPVISGPIVPTCCAVPARTPTIGWVETRGTSRYRTDGLPAGPHTISIVGSTGDVVFHVYGDDTYTIEFDCTLRDFDAQECTVTGTSIFFAVSSGPVNRDGAGYIMLVW